MNWVPPVSTRRLVLGVVVMLVLFGAGLLLGVALHALRDDPAVQQLHGNYTQVSQAWCLDQGGTYHVTPRLTWCDIP
jgi:hypothetical protein